MRRAAPCQLVTSIMLHDEGRCATRTVFHEPTDYIPVFEDCGEIRSSLSPALALRPPCTALPTRTALRSFTLISAS